MDPKLDRTTNGDGLALLIDASCSWETNIENKSINDCIILKMQNEVVDNDENLTDIMDIEKTVNFIKTPGVADNPVIKFKLRGKEDLYISSVTVLCDSRALEIYGEHGTYLTTLNGRSVEESEGFYVYEHKTTFDKSVNMEISLKLVRMMQRDHFWIYGVLLTLKKKPFVEKESSISFNKVEEYMRNIQLSDKASQALKNLKEVSSNQHFERDDFQSFASKLADTSYNQHLPAEVRQYIDYKFQILTDLLILREKNLSDKLDRVIDLLKCNDMH